MKRYDPLASIGIVLILLLSSVGCSKSDNAAGNSSGSSASPSGANSAGSKTPPASNSSFVGTWKPTADSDPGMKVDSLTIKDDGTFSMHPKDSSGPDLTGKWTGSGNRVTLEMSGPGRPLEMVLETDGRLTVQEGGKTAHFTKS